METSPSDNRLIRALGRGVAAILGVVRRVLAGIFQVVFNDRLRDISQKTDRLGSASVESVTYLGGEVHALDQRLAAIERELTALREMLESRQGGAAAEEGSEQVPARPPAG
ncbi:MAG TPA: hypothetical protein VFN72_09195 [Solirubrobacterales bacterium]|nr:hypothetical protein [Solirubrobacterales bacterium]